MPTGARGGRRSYAIASVDLSFLALGFPRALLLDARGRYSLDFLGPEEADRKAWSNIS